MGELWWILLPESLWIPESTNGNPEQLVNGVKVGARVPPLQRRELLAKDQVLQSNIPNNAGQYEKANQPTKQRNHEVLRDGPEGGEVN